MIDNVNSRCSNEFSIDISKGASIKKSSILEVFFTKES